MVKTKIILKKVKDISIGGGLAAVLLGNGMMACRSANQEEYQTEEVFSQGVRSYINEVKPGEFKITEEIAVPADSSRAIVTYLNGKTETISTEQSKALIDQEIFKNEQNIGHSSTLSNVLLYGGMGYFLGRTTSPGYQRFRPDMQQNKDKSTSSRIFGGIATRAAMGRFYSNNAVFQKSEGVNRSISGSRVSFSRPSGGRSGFFGRSSRGFGG